MITEKCKQRNSCRSSRFPKNAEPSAHKSPSVHFAHGFLDAEHRDKLLDETRLTYACPSQEAK